MSRIHDLMDKFVSGICSKDEFEELMLLLQANKNEEVVRSFMQKTYNALDSEIVSDVHVDEQGYMFRNNKHEAAQKYRPAVLKSVLVALCTISIVCIACFFYYTASFRKQDNGRAVSRIYTSAGSKTSIVLPDGSEVWLNAFSSLTYTTAGFSSRREVSLIGEAMFKVKHDSLHPFLVHTENFDVMDLGTVFNVQAYPEDRDAKASLISGSIEIITKEIHSKKILLIPHQRIVIPNKNIEKSTPAISGAGKPVISPIIPDNQISIAPDTAWMVNKLIFMDECFGDLALQMQRRYNVKISFVNEKTRHYKFTGRFEDENIDEALKELQAIAPFTYIKSKNDIDIE